MTHPITFTDVLYIYLRDLDGMSETVAEWMQIPDLDAEKREVQFACNLAEDFETQFRAASRDREETGLLGRLAMLAGSHTNWRRIARRLLRHFGCPERLAVPNYRRKVSPFVEPVAGFSVN